MTTPTTDRELLELAAKAAGYEYAKHGGYIVVDGIPGNWNPLTDDGDALRLAVKLRLSIDHNHPADQQHWVAADRNGCEGCYAPVSCVELREPAGVHHGHIPPVRDGVGSRGDGHGRRP